MKEPRRWRDDGGGAPPGARDLLRAARPTPTLDKRTLSLSAALVAKLAATPSAAAALPIAVKVVASASLLGVLVTVGVQVVAPARHDAPSSERRAHAPQAPSRPPRPRAEQAQRKAEAAIPAALPERIAPAPDRSRALAAAGAIEPEQSRPAPASDRPAASGRPFAARAESAAPTSRPSFPARPAGSHDDAASGSEQSVPPSAAPAQPAPDELAREVALLDRARTELPRDPAAALDALGQHAAQFPRAALAAERELLAVDALVRLGRGSEARARAERLVQQFSRTMYRERLRAILERSAGSAPR